MDNNILYYKGTFESYKNWLTDLYDQSQQNGPDSLAAKKYNSIYNSVVYISEHIGDNPDELCCNDGAIYAHGAIIAGGGGSATSLDIAGKIVNIVEVDGEFFNDVDDPEHTTPIVDEQVSKAGNYLMITLTNDDTPIYIKNDELVNLTDYYDSDEIDKISSGIYNKISIMDSSIDSIDASIADINDTLLSMQLVNIDQTDKIIDLDKRMSWVTLSEDDLLLLDQLENEEIQDEVIEENNGETTK